MIVIMQVGATKTQVAAVVANVQKMGLNGHVIEGQERTIVAVVGDDRSAIDRNALSALDGVERTVPILAPYKIASREVHPANTLIPFNGASIGDRKIVIIAGPRALLQPEQILEIASALRDSGADGLYAGVFGYDASPYTARTPVERSLQLLAEAHKQSGLPIVAEVTEPELVPLIAKYAEVLLVTGENMQNYPLLNTVGESQRSILLKRGMVNTMEELLMAAEYILSHGNRQVMLCEAGIRTLEGYTQNTTFDINAVPVLKAKTHLPIIVDASRAAGHYEYVGSAAKAAIAAGADGLIIDVDGLADTTPTDSDGRQALNARQFSALIEALRPVAEAVGRTI
jgi:3-deoxy-7-phosphoheptulonate synthase